MITIYSNGCPKCKVLKSYLDKHEVEYEESKDFKKLIDKGITKLPVVEFTDGNLLTFDEMMLRLEGDVK